MVADASAIPTLHVWVRAEQRANELRHPLTPEGAAKLIAAGCKVTVEASRQRTIPLAEYTSVGCSSAPEGSWVHAPSSVIVLGLKELPDDGTGHESSIKGSAQR